MERGKKKIKSIEKNGEVMQANIKKSFLDELTHCRMRID